MKKSAAAKFKLSKHSPKKSFFRLGRWFLMLALLAALPFGVIYALSSVYLMRGDNLLEGGKVEEAIAAYEAALTFNSNDAQAYFKLGRARQQQKQYYEALAAYDKAFLINPTLNVDPSLAAELNQLGDVFKKEGKLSQAINAYQKAVTLEPFYSEAYYNLGKALFEQRRWDEAIQAYKKAIEIDSLYVQAYIDLGNIYLEQQEWETAQNIYQKVLQFKPYDAQVQQQLGKTLKEQGKLQAAIDTYLQALTFDPNNADLYNLLGEALYEQKNIVQAIAAYQQALEISPKNAHTYKNLCYAQISLKELTIALEFCQQALKLDPNLVDVKFYVQEIDRTLAIRNNPKLQMSERIPSAKTDSNVAVKRSIVKILIQGRNYYSFGTGWVIKREKNKIWLVTNRHVVTNSNQKPDPKAKIAVEFYSTPEKGEIRKRQVAKILHTTSPEDGLDLAVLEVENVPADIKPLSLSLLQIPPTTPIRVIGNPSNGESWSIVTGEVRENSKEEIVLSMLLVSGHSGSPVLDQQNRVIGLVSQAGLFCNKIAVPGSVEMALRLGCGLAIPIEQVHEQLKVWGVIDK